jgi:predicted Zn-ribbon and HTH transcriptional regulator
MKYGTFKRMQDVASTLQLHASVEQRAQMLFTKYRDSREHVQKLNVVEAACMVAATRELKRKRKRTSSDAFAQKAIEDQVDETSSYEALHPFACKSCGMRFNQKKGVRVHRFSCEKK